MMTRQIGPTVEILLRRVRQEGSLAVDPDFATNIYSLCEQIINTFTQRVLTTGTLTIPKEKLLFNYRDEFSDAIDIIEIRNSSTGARIDRFPSVRAMAAYDPDGFRKIDGTAVQAWCQIGRDILILYPGLASPSTVEVTYVKLLTEHTDFVASYNTASELPDEDIEAALVLAEITLLARLRQLSEMKAKMEAFAKKYKIGRVK